MRVLLITLLCLANSILLKAQKPPVELFPAELMRAQKVMLVARYEIPIGNTQDTTRNKLLISNWKDKEHHFDQNGNRIQTWEWEKNGRRHRFEQDFNTQNQMVQSRYSFSNWRLKGLDSSLALVVSKTYEYDRQGRLAKEQWYQLMKDTEGPPTDSILYHYDNRDQLKATTHFSTNANTPGGESALSERNRYGLFDKAENISIKTHTIGNTIANVALTKKDEKDRIIEEVHYGEAYQFGVAVEGNLPEEVWTWLRQSGESLVHGYLATLHLKHRYDEAGNLKMTENILFGIEGTLGQDFYRMHYHYDDKGLLTRVLREAQPGIFLTRKYQYQQYDQ